MGVHVFQDDMSCESIVLCEVMCRWSACLYDGISCHMFCFTGRHFLLDDMFYLRVCIVGGHVLQFMLLHWNTCFTGGHILLDDSSYRRTPPV